MIKDAGGAVTWSSKQDGGSLSAAQGWLYQITSGGKPNISCIFSGAMPSAVRLVSQDQSFALQVTAPGAQLNMTGPDGGPWWSPAGALQGHAPAKLCITRQAVLQLNGSAPGPASLWNTQYAAMPVSNGPFTAEITADGCLDILDGACKLVWSSHDDSKSQRSLPGVVKAGRSRPRPPAPATTSKLGKLPKGFNTTTLPVSIANKQTVPAASGTSKTLQVAASEPSLLGTKSAVVAPDTTRTSDSRPALLSASRAAATCMLVAGQACGGIGMCGSDGPCAGNGCCAAGLACVRHTAFTYACGAGARTRMRAA